MVHFARTGDITPRKFSDFSDRQRGASGLYTDFFQKLRAMRANGGPIPTIRRGKRLVGVSVSRSRVISTSAHRACLAVLCGHAAQAIRNASGFALLRSNCSKHFAAAAALEGSRSRWPWRSQPGFPRRAAVTPRVPLTKRESEVLYWAGIAYTNGEIVVIIGAASGTVKKHLEHVYEKLAVRNDRGRAICHPHCTHPRRRHRPGLQGRRNAISRRCPGKGHLTSGRAGCMPRGPALTLDRFESLPYVGQIRLQKYRITRVYRYL